MKGWPAWATEGLGKGKEVRAEIDAALGAAAADPPVLVVRPGSCRSALGSGSAGDGGGQ